MNLKNLNLLIKRLKYLRNTEESKRFNMRYFGTEKITKNDKKIDNSIFSVPVCHTQACLAGETVLLTGSGKIKPKGGIKLLTDESNIFGVATRDLDLTINQAERLFYFKEWNDGINGWPAEYEKMYLKAKTPTERLNVAIKRMKCFIKTKGRC